MDKKKNISDVNNTNNEALKKEFASDRSVKDILTGKGTKRGTYTAGIIALVVAIVVIFNLILGQLPSNLMEFDISDSKIYTLSQDSIDFLAELDTDIEIVVLADNGKVDSRLQKFFDHYEAASPYISIEVLDSTQYPSLLDKYGASQNSVNVTCPATGRFKSINIKGYADAIFTYAFHDDYSAYESQFDGEGLLASAITYVTGNVSHKVHVLAGHGEADISYLVRGDISKANYEVVDLDILRDQGIPEDCEFIICYDPQLDLSVEERRLIQEWMDQGNDFLLITDNASLENFSILLRTYGMKIDEGYLGDKKNFYYNFYNRYGYKCFSPSMEVVDSITNRVYTQNAYVYNPRPITYVTEGARDTVALDDFIYTSEYGVWYKDDGTEETGEYIFGAVSTDILPLGYNESGEARMILISTPSILDREVIATYSNMANSGIIMGCINSNDTFDDTRTVDIPAKDIAVVHNNFSDYNKWSMMFIVILPLLTLGGGLAFWVYRRRH